MGSDIYTNKIQCQPNFEVKKIYKLQLLSPNIAIDTQGNRGTWTMIYNQGFEVVIDKKKFFAFSKYEKRPDGNITSSCHETLIGTFHDEDGNNWGCYLGIKRNPKHTDIHVGPPLVINGAAILPPM